MLSSSSRRAPAALVACAALIGIAAIASSEPAPGPPACDVNGDGTCDVADLDIVTAEIAAGTNAPAADLTGDGLVNLDDRDAWLAGAGGENGIGGPYLLADLNLDTVVDGSDFLDWNANRFTATGTWSLGDFNADGVTDVSDFNLWNERKFTSAGP